MASLTSNRQSVVAEFKAMTGGIGFDKRGRSRTLGDEVRKVIAQAVIDQTVNAQKEPSGAPLAALAESTLREKARHGYPSEILVRTGAMLAERQLEGEAEVSADSLEITYGVDAENRMKAERAEQGSRKRRRPPRRFFAIPETAKPSVERVIKGGLEAQAKRGGCGPATGE